MQKFMLTLVCLYTADAFAATQETKAKSTADVPSPISPLVLLSYCRQMTPAEPLITPTNRFYDPIFWQPFNQCPVVDEKFIAKHIVGATPVVCQTLVQAILEIRAIDPMIAKYIDLVFMRLPGFMIEVYSKVEEEKSLSLGVAIAGKYQWEVHKIQLWADSITANSLRNLAIIRHEFLHAAVHTSYLLLGNVDSKEAKQRQGFNLQLGRERIKNLKNLLELEKDGVISQKNKLLLESWRLLIKKDQFDKYYGGNGRLVTRWQLENSEFDELEQTLNKKIEVGGVYSFLAVQKKQGTEDFSVDEINKDENKTILKIVPVIPHDPLTAIVYLDKEIAKFSSIYEESGQLDEHITCLIERIPVPFLKEFFPEIMEEVSDLVQKALLTRSPYCISIPDHSDTTRLIPLYPKYQRVNESEFKAEVMLRNPCFFTADESDDYIKWIELAIKSDRIEDARMGLSILIQKGFNVGKADLLLARIEFGAGNYKEVATYYKRAEKRGIELTAKDLGYYADALKFIEHYKEATKVSKRFVDAVSSSS